MEETAFQERTGLFSRVAGLFARQEEYDTEEEVPETIPGPLQLKSAYRYTVTVRRQIVAFDDALAAANGLKRGEQQILNLSATDAVTRQKIVDFMSGVNYAQEGTWEEVGDGVYLLVPPNAYVEVAPACPRATQRN
jgi:cell division inhibitor SepF